MYFNELIPQNQLDFTGIDQPLFLIGMLSAFENRYQATADKFFEEISWKQFFAIICINLCKEPPTLKELSALIGSSHQNVKQILLKLERKGFVQLLPDEKDKRKQRITLTDKTRAFCKKHDAGSSKIIGSIFQGINPNDLEITLKTIIKMEKNLRGIEI